MISSLEAEKQYSDWPTLKHALGSVYEPRYSEEQHRLGFFSIRQQGQIESYIADFNRVSLQVAELDELSRTILFTNGLQGDWRLDVLKAHPTLSEAIQAALSIAADTWLQSKPTVAAGFRRTWRQPA